MKISIMLILFDKHLVLFYAGLYSRNPLISLIRDKIVLQLQLITPGSVAISEIMKPVEEYDNVKR